MHIQLSDHFTYPRLLRFVMPSIVMMVFTSIYSVVDGLFVSNLVGKVPFAAINLIMPFLMALSVIGFMVGTGGSAIVSRSLGEGKRDRAQQEFSLLVWTTAFFGVVTTVLGLLFLRPVSLALGAQGEMLENCILYGGISLLAQTPFMLQVLFQSFFVTAEKPRLGLGVTVAAGVTNMVLDALLIAVFHWGLAGAAIATALSQVVGGLFPLFYFARPNSSLLRLVRPRMDWGVLRRTCTNGSSELMSNLSSSLVNALYNFQLLRLVGEDGVAAYGVIMYVCFIFAAVFLGYSIGSAPIVGFHYGAGHQEELKNLLQKSLVIIGCGGVSMLLLAEWAAGPLSRIFVGYDAALMELTRRGFRLYALSFLLSGFNIFGSGFFTALSNGPVSAAISFLRTLVFQTAAILLLPMVLPGADGIWLAIVAAELLALAVTAAFFVSRRKQYHYW